MTENEIAVIAGLLGALFGLCAGAGAMRYDLRDRLKAKEEEHSLDP